MARITTAAVRQKKTIPSAGRKLTAAQARKMVNKQFGKAFAKLAK